MTTLGKNWKVKDSSKMSSKGMFDKKMTEKAKQAIREARLKNNPGAFKKGHPL